MCNQLFNFYVAALIHTVANLDAALLPTVATVLERMHSSVTGVGNISLAGAATSFIFVETKVLLQQTHLSVTTKHVFCCDKCMRAVTIFLHVTFVITNTCHDKTCLLLR